MSVSRDLVASLMGAIVDSGASFTYVTNGVKLSEVRPGRGHVWVADGRRENVHETGTLGPLTNVKKVRSFPRSLISVRDIVEKFGGVYFDGRGVHVVTLGDGVSIGDLTGGDGIKCVTEIGQTTPARLYSFDIDQLEAHRQSCSA